MKKLSVALCLIVSFQPVYTVSQNAEETKIPARWRVRALWRASKEANRRLHECVERNCAEQKKELEEARTKWLALRDGPPRQKSPADIPVDFKAVFQPDPGHKREVEKLRQATAKKEIGYRRCSKDRCRREMDIDNRMGWRLAGTVALMMAAGITVGAEIVAAVENQQRISRLQKKRMGE